jgi:hypothetical protein
MTIAFECRCGREFEFLDVHAGKAFRCPRCRSRLVVPIPDLPTEIYTGALAKDQPAEKVEDDTDPSTEYQIARPSQADPNETSEPERTARGPEKPAAPAASGPRKPAVPTTDFDPYATIDPALQASANSVASSAVNAVASQAPPPPPVAAPGLEELARMVEDLRRRVERLEARAGRGEG